jgi:hypothetical protein
MTIVMLLAAFYAIQLLYIGMYFTYLDINERLQTELYKSQRLVLYFVPFYPIYRLIKKLL